MFEADLDSMTKAELKKFLHLGEKEIERQLSLRHGILLDRFREAVLQLVNDGTVIITDKNKSTAYLTNPIAYYDAEYYYFCKDSFATICQRAAIDVKSQLSVKQQLAEQNFVKHLQMLWIAQS